MNILAQLRRRTMGNKKIEAVVPRLKDGLPAQAFAIVGDQEDPVTWQLPHHTKAIFRAIQGKVGHYRTTDREHLSAAVAALSRGGFRGKRVEATAQQSLEARLYIKLMNRRRRRKMLQRFLDGKKKYSAFIVTVLATMIPLFIQEPEAQKTILDMVPSAAAALAGIFYIVTQGKVDREKEEDALGNDEE